MTGPALQSITRDEGGLEKKNADQTDLHAMG